MHVDSCSKSLKDHFMSQHKIRTFSLCSAAAIMLAASSAAVQAQPQPASASRRAHFSNSQLRAYAKAAVQVQKIGQQEKVTLQPAKTATQRQAAMAGVRSKEVQAVKSDGLAVRQYQAIFAAAKGNPQVRAKIDGYIKSFSGR